MDEICVPVQRGEPVVPLMHLFGPTGWHMLDGMPTRVSFLLGYRPIDRLLVIVVVVDRIGHEPVQYSVQLSDLGHMILHLVDGTECNENHKR
jgi:hypothetical protein